MGKLTLFKTKKTCGFIDFSLGSLVCDLNGQQQTVNLTATIICPPKSPPMEREIINGVENELLLWLKKKQLPVTQSVIDARFSFIFPTCLRNLSPTHLLTASQFIAWLFIFDDVLDKSAKSLNLNATNMRVVFETLINIVRNKSNPKEIDEVMKGTAIQFPLFAQFCHALSEIGASLRTITQGNGADLNYFINKFSHYIKSLETELEDRDEEYVQSEQQYRKMRKNNGAVPTTFAFLAALKGITLNEELFKNQHFKNMANAGTIALSYFNDVVSIKEFFEEDHANILKILFNDRGELKKAFEQTIELINKETQDLLFPRAFLLENEQSKQFYQLICDCLYDNASWSIQETKRYKEFNDETGKPVSMPFSMKYYEDELPDQKKKIHARIHPLETSIQSAKL